MPTDSSPSDAASPAANAVRFSRVRRLPHLVTAGTTVTVGLGVYALFGQFFRLSPAETTGAYALLLVLALPLILTYAERVACTPGSGGAFSLTRNSGKTWLVYASGWLSLGGNACMVALLGWGVALHLDLFGRMVFGEPLSLPLLAAAVIGLMALNSISGVLTSRRSTPFLITASIVFLLYIILRDLFALVPDQQTTTALFRSPGTVIPLTALMISGLWGLNVIINAREEIHRPARTVLPALLIVVVLGSILGVLASLSLSCCQTIAKESLTPLLVIATLRGQLPTDLTTGVYAGLGTLINLAALKYGMTGGFRLIGIMTRDGFFPDRMHLDSEKYQTPVVSTTVLAVSGILLAYAVPVPLLAGLAALSFLWTSVLVHAPDLFRPSPNLPTWRTLKLPFHPLLPGLVVAIGIFLPLALPIQAWEFGGLWAVLGLIYYALYARRGRMEEHRRETVVGHSAREMPEDTSSYKVMAGIAHPKRAASLIAAGARLAQAQKGVLLVLHVLALPEQVPMQTKRLIAQDQLDYLQGLIQDVAVEDVTIRPLVRLAPSPIAGIVETIREENVDLLLMGWQGNSPNGRGKPPALLEPIVSRAPCDVVILKGELPPTVNCAAVPISGGPNAPKAVSIGQTLVGPGAGKVVAFNLVTGTLTPTREAEAQEHLEAGIQSLQDTSNIETRIVEVQTVKSGILDACEECDVLLMGISREGLFDSNTLEGLPSQIVSASDRPVMLVRRRESIRHYWLRRGWEIFTDPLPNLTAAQRDEVAQQLRQAAQPTIDFFVLIILSATIATYGLIDNSIAVIIGAMLVAPLMSPILSMGLSLVHGNLQLLRIAAETTLKGIALAIVVSIAMTLISPYKAPTEEIVARTGPDLTDLIVALASGAAAGYAISRKEVAAALPGVAIAVSLVPPLCVVGYGMGTSQLSIAAGSLLLFATNLTAIVFAAAVTFLALGFYPKLSRTQAKKVRTRGLIVTIVSLVLISTILCFFTTTTIRRVNNQREVEAILRNQMANKVTINDVAVEQIGDGYHVRLTLVDLDARGITAAEIQEMERKIVEATGGPITVEVVTISGNRIQVHEGTR